MSIVISRSGQAATRLDRTTVDSEDYLQSYIYENPEVLPLDEYKEGLQLLILAREFPTGSGPIDALGVDQDGEIYLIETKLYKNPDKRLVLAQVLDYGASLWRTYGDPEEFISRLHEIVSQKRGTSLTTELEKAFGDAEWDADEHLDTIRENVSAGSFRFVVLMDRLEERLKDLITFMNQNSRFDVFGVELEFYRHGELEILIPDLYGAEVKKNVGGGSASSARRKWDEQTFFDDAEGKLNADELMSVRQLYEWSQERADRVDWGTGTNRGSFNVKFDQVSPRSVLSVFSDGEVWWNFRWLNETESARSFARLLGEALSEIEDLTIPEDFLDQHPEVSASAWAPHVTEITRILDQQLRSFDDSESA